MDNETKIRMALLMREAAFETGEAVFAFYRDKDCTVAFFPVEKLVEQPELRAMGAAKAVPFVELGMREDGYELIALLGVRLTDDRVPLIEDECVPDASGELVRIVKQAFWDHLVTQGKITPKAAGV